MRISTENKQKYDNVMEEFDSYFQIRKNMIFKCVWFNKRNLLPKEPVEEFISKIYHLADRYFKNIKD